MSSVKNLLILLVLFLLPTQAWARADQARQAMMAGAYQRAASTLGREAARAAADPDAGPHLRYLQGRALQLNGDHKGAIRAFDRLLRDFPDSPWARKARFCRADSLSERGQSDQSSATYREQTDALLAVERRDELGRGFLSLAHAAFEPEDEKEAPDHRTARVLFATVLELEPGDAVRQEAEHYLARADIELGNHLQATRLLSQRLDQDLNPMAAADRYHLARALSSSDPAEAIRQYHLLARLHPDATELGDALWQAGQLQAPEGSASALDPEGAVADLRALLERCPEHEQHAAAHLRIARVLAWNGRLQQAAEAYRGFIDAPQRAQSEDRPQAMVELARLLERMGREQQAQEVYRAYSAAYPTHSEWPAVQLHLSNQHQRRGYELYQAGDADGAVAAFEAHAQAHAAEDAEVRYLIGLIRYQQGRLDQAQAAFEVVASKFPRHPAGSRAEYALARIMLEEKRDVAQAREHLQRCLESGGPRYGDCSALMQSLETEGLDLYVDRPLRSDEEPQIWLRARNLEQVELTLHRVDPEILMRKEGSVEAMDSLDVELIEPDRRWEQPLEGATGGLTWSGMVDLPSGEPGVYMVGATGETMRAQIQLVISDITIATHRQGGDVLVYVQDRRQGKPVRGARVLLSDGQAVFTEGRTGGDGTWLYRPALDGDATPPQVVALALKGRQMATATVSGHDPGKPEELPAVSYLFTDRPAYRPAASVGYRALLRRQHDRRTQGMAGEQVRMRLISPQGWEIRAWEAELDRFGALGGQLTLESEYGNGSYSLAVDVRQDDGTWGTAGAASFQVTDTAPSRRLLSIEFDRPSYVLGDQVQARVRAATYTGEPITGARLQVQWAHEREPSQTEPTDQNGEVLLSTSTLNHGGLGAVHLSASLAGEPVQAQAAAPVRDAELDLSLELDRDTLRVGEALHARLQATSAAEGAPPVEQALEVALHHRPAAPSRAAWEGNPFAVPLWEEEAQLVPLTAPAAQPARIQQLMTDAQGQAQADWVLDAPGTWRVVALGRDARGNLVRSESTVQVVEEGGPAQGLAVLTERSSVFAGETIPVDVLGTAPGPVLAILDADGIAMAHTAQLHENQSQLSVTLDEALAPRARLTVLALRDDRIISGQLDLEVAARLEVALEGLEEEPLPGSTLGTRIAVTDEAGRPVDAQLSVAVTDASLLARFPETRRDATGVFLPATHALDCASAGATALRSAGPGMEIDAAILAEKERQKRERRRAEPIAAESIASYDYAPEEEASLDDMGSYGAKPRAAKAGYAPSRSRSSSGRASARQTQALQVEAFHSESALWLADLRTGPDGVVELSIPLPARSAAWKVTVLAFDEGIRSGELQQDVVARAPLSVALAPPSFVREGDQPALVADLVADGGGTYRVQGALGAVALTPQDLELPQRGPLSLAVPAGPVRASQATRSADGALLVPFQLSLEGAAGRATDQLGSPLASADVPLERWQAGRLLRSTEISLRPPEGSSGDLQLLLEVSPASLPGALALNLARPSLCIRSPYTNAHLAFAATALLDGSGDRRLPADQERMLRSLARSHLLALLEDRRDFGQRWSRPGSGHDGSLTAFGYVALVRGARLELLPGQAREKAASKAADARTQLLRQLRDDAGRSPAHQALLIYALSFEQGDDATWSAALTRQLREPGSPAALGRLAAAAVRLGLRQDVADQHGALESALQEAISSGDAETLAAASEGLHALDAGNPLLNEAADAIEAQLDSPWLPTHRLASLCAALARLQGAGRSPTTLRLRLPDGSEERIDFAKQPRAHRFTATVPWAESVELLLEPAGRGPVRYRAGIAARPGQDSSLPDDPRLLVERKVHRPDLHFRGIPIAQGYGSLTGSYQRWYDELVQLPVGQQAQVELEIRYERGQDRAPSGTVWILEELLAGGVTVVPGSISGVLHAEVASDRIVAYLDASRSSTTLRYRVAGASPGSWTLPAPLLRELSSGQVIEVGPAGSLQVSTSDTLIQGEIEGVSYPAAPYRLTPDERYGLGLRLAEEERWAEVATVFGELLAQSALDKSETKKVAAALLSAWVALEDPQGTLQAFELLKERDPSFRIPFEQVVAVARAYEDLGEHHRAVRVYRTTLGARFLTEARLGRVLEQQALVLPALRYQYDLGTAYPDLSPVQSNLFHLPQIWADHAEQAAGDPQLKALGYDRLTLLATSADWMLEFAARYPGSPLAEEAGFHLAGTYLELEDHRSAIDASRVFTRRFPEGPYLDELLYMEGHARRAEGQTAAALRLLQRVASESFTPQEGGAQALSDQQPLALYAIAQIHDAQGQVTLALERYKEVSDRFRDAAEAAARLERVELSAEQVTTIPLTGTPRLQVTSRNVPQADMLLYQVDLMRLYLREKNLSRVTDVRLAGIEPANKQTVPLQGRTHLQQQTDINLPLARPGAYLVVLKGEDAELSAMVLYSNLELECQEDRSARRVRVTVTDPAGHPVEDAHVKVIGSSGGAIVSGDTDLRGVFAADGVRGVPTVIARRGEHYAFWSGPAAAPPPLQLPSSSAPREVDLLENLRKQGLKQRGVNRAEFEDSFYGPEVQGISIEALE